MNKLTCAICLALLFSITMARAATVNLYVNYPDGIAGTHWQISTDDAPANAGLYGVGFNIKNITTFAFEKITASFQNTLDQSITSYGFTVTLWNQGVDLLNLNPSSTLTVVIAQGLADPNADYLYGVGQFPGNTSTLAPPPNSTLLTSTSYASPILLFEGNKPAGAAIALNSLNAGVFNVAGLGAKSNELPVPSANIAVTTVPEPSSIVLVSTAALGFLACRRRFSP